MKYGYLNVRALSPGITPGRPIDNARVLCESARDAGAQITLFPELCLTGYTAGDLFLRPHFLSEAWRALEIMAREVNELAFVGLPVIAGGRVYNCMAALAGGQLAGLVPKPFPAGGQGRMEARWFESGARADMAALEFMGVSVPFATDLIFEETGSGVTVGVCFASALREGARLPDADVVLCPDAEAYSFEEGDLTRDIIFTESRRGMTTIAYANAGLTESTAEGVYTGEAFVAQAPTKAGERECADIEGARFRRRFLRSEFCPRPRVKFTLGWEKRSILPAKVERAPYLSADARERSAQCASIVAMQSRALAERLKRAGARKAIVGVSGGLDSTLALIAASEAMKLNNWDSKRLIAVTMPGFGTSGQTRNNADELMRALGADAREIPISSACAAHLKAIGHDALTPDVAYENAQARERTQILMDIANIENALVVGTGDLSELALGFCTYNGDHMSMYAVNASLPKSVIREVVRHWADTHARLHVVLMGILGTPISPELKPAGADGGITQKTEDIVGKYELNDFFMYHLLVNGFSAEKTKTLASIAFASEYAQEAIEQGMARFERRFFSQQFKRACAPDGPCLGPLSFSPRGGWMTPSDVSAGL